MNKVERFILGGLCVILLTLTFGIWGYSAYQNHQDETASSSSSTPRKSYTTTGSLKLPEYYTFGANNDYVITDDYALVGQDYILTFKAKLLSYHFNYSCQPGEYVKFAYQKIDGASSSRKTVNLSKLANGYKKGYYLQRKISTLNYHDFKLNAYVLNYQGTDYLICFVGKDDTYNTSDWIALAYNLESGELTEATTEMLGFPTDTADFNFKQDGIYQRSLYQPLDQTNTYNYLASNKFDVRFNIKLYSDDNNSEDINLFSENSSLQAQIDAGKDVFIYPRYNQVTPEMWFNNVLHWFAPSGQERLTVYMQDGSDAVKSTPITSYADYLALENKEAS